jgi:FMN reductase
MNIQSNGSKGLTIKIVGISGSPSATSRTAKVVDYILRDLAADGVETSHVRCRDLPAESLLFGDMKQQAIAEAVEAVGAANGVIVATPIFKASCSGMLKSFLDILPQFGLAGKTVLPIATGGSMAHVLALDYGLRPVLQSMGGRHIVQSQFVVEAQVTEKDGVLGFEEPTASGLAEAVYHFKASLGLAPSHDFLGHPRPSEAMAARTA